MTTSKVSDVDISPTGDFNDAILDDKQDAAASSVAAKYRGTATDQKDMMVSQMRSRDRFYLTEVADHD